MNWLSFSHGAALCASLIVTIGAQNAFVLRQGIMRSHVGKIVALCALSDFILIGAGVGGASVLVARYPVFVHTMLYGGLAYLAWFGINALRRVVHRYDPYTLAGLGIAVPALGSLVLGLALAEGQLDAAEAHRLGALEELFQVEQWGEDEEAARRRANVAADIAVAARFMRLARA